MARDKKRKFYIALESGGYGVDPSTDGSSYLYVPALTVGAPEDTLELLPTDYATGRNFETAPEPGADGGTLTITTPMMGQVTAAGVGVNGSAAALGWMGTILTHVFGTVRTTAGIGVAAASTTTSLILDAPTYTAQDLIPVWETALPTTARPRTQWVKGNSVATNTWAVSPTMATAPSTAAVAYGARFFTPSDAGGFTLAGTVVDDEIIYLLSGGRISAYSWECDHGGMWRMSITIRFDSKTEQTSVKTALPVATAGPAVTPLKGMRSPVNFNNAFYGTRKISIDWGIESAVVGDTAGVNGRGGDEVIAFKPKVTIEPLRTDAIVNLKRAQTAGQLQIQVGAGVLSGGVLNTICVDFDRATARAVTYSSENGRTRQVVEFGLADRVIFTGVVESYPFQIALA